MAEGVILSLGSVNVDVQVRAARWPDPEETLPTEQFALLGGGKAANVAFLVRRLGHPAWLLARVGDDVFSEHALAPLRDAQVDLRGVRQAAGEHTGVAIVAVQANGRKGILLSENANQKWTEADIDETEQLVEDAPDGSVLALDMEVPIKVVRRCVEAASRRGFDVVLDPSPADRVSADLLKMVTAVTPNVGEAEKLVGQRITSTDQARSAVQRLCEKGVKIAVVKLNDGGCVFARDGDIDRVPAAGVKAVDTTGAGDAFTGALAVALLEGKPTVEAVRYAVATAQYAVQTYGSQPAYPNRSQLEKTLSAYSG